MGTNSALRAGSLEERRVVINNLSLRALVAIHPAADHLPPVVLVHGLGVSARYMRPVALRLARSVSVYAPELPGAGGSEKPPRALNVSGLAAALAAWLEAVGISEATLVGHSLGCQVVVEAALRYPAKVKRAVLAAPTVDPANRTVLRQLWRLLRAAPREPLRLIPIVIGDYLTAGLLRTARTFQYSLQDRIEDKLPRIVVPTLVIGGARDPLAPPAWAREAARLLPRGELAIIPEAAHAMNYSAPEQCAQLILEFLQRD